MSAVEFWFLFAVFWASLIAISVLLGIALGGAYRRRRRKNLGRDWFTVIKG